MIAEGLAVFGTVLKGIGDYQDAQFQASMARQDAADERQAATMQAQRILRAAERLRGAARAATAASGAKIDQFSLANETDILAAGETDAAMTILGGERDARMLETKSRLLKAKAKTGIATSLFSLGSQAGGWKGTIGPGGAPDERPRGQRGYD